MSWKPEVIADASKEFRTNALRFATKDEAEAYAKDLARRWRLVTATRALQSTDPVNYAFEGGRLKLIHPPKDQI